MCKESGIFDQWKKETLDMQENRFSNFWVNEKTSLFSFNELTVGQVFDLFYLFLFGMFLTIIYFVIESHDNIISSINKIILNINIINRITARKFTQIYRKLLRCILNRNYHGND